MSRRRPPTHASRAQAATPYRVALPVAVAGLVAALLVQGGIAYAYFGAASTGTGHASVGSAVTVTVTGATGAPSLVPGGSGPVYFTLTNHNPFAVTFTSITAASVKTSSAAACPSTQATIGAWPSVDFTVGPHSTSAVESIPGLVQLSSTAPSACQGVTFTVHLILTGTTK